MSFGVSVSLTANCFVPEWFEIQEGRQGLPTTVLYYKVVDLFKVQIPNLDHVVHSMFLNNHILSFFRLSPGTCKIYKTGCSSLAQHSPGNNDVADILFLFRGRGMKYSSEFAILSAASAMHWSLGWMWVAHMSSIWSHWYDATSSGIAHAITTNMPH